MVANFRFDKALHVLSDVEIRKTSGDFVEQVMNTFCANIGAKCLVHLGRVGDAEAFAKKGMVCVPASDQPTLQAEAKVCA